MEQQYGSVIQEQGDLGLGEFQINESEQKKEKEQNEKK